MTKKKRREKIKKASDKLVKWIGSPNSLIFHTAFFVIMIFLAFSDMGFDKMMLVLTTVVSLEAIYLSIFIQMTVNKHSEELEEVSEDIDEIQEDVEEIEKDVDEIQKDVDEIQEDVEDIQGEEEIGQEVVNLKSNRILLNKIEENLGRLIEEVLEIKKQSKEKKVAKTNNKFKRTPKQQYSLRK
ncbi:DUF1003 domain-containing protein [Patescibacteria group bacterium]|nr:DUF1003 domain-containing protein [Patescibacteria group bacterium]MBU1728017.1 DUF1003 domain-containing protein [Patescibacteria group bacterium]